MALVLKDRVLENSLSTGTGAFTLAGPQVGYQSFSVIGNGNTTYYTIQGKYSNGNLNGEWEVGVGTWSTGNILSRDIVLESSNSNNLVVFSAGDKDVFCDLPAEKVSPTDVLGTMAYQNANAVNITGGTVDVSAGTAALPTLGTTGDPNTGVFFPAADTVAVATNGVEATRVDSAGRLGIGIAPSARLHSYNSGGGTTARLQTGTTANGNFLDYQNAAGTRQGIVGFIDSTNLYVHNDASASIIFDTNNTERMRIDSTGNVGIGSTNPANKLEIQQNGASTSTAIALSSSLAAGLFVRKIALITAGNTPDQSIEFAYTDRSNDFSGYIGFSTSLNNITRNVERMRITNTGNVGIGTASPNGRLQVGGGANATASMSDGQVQIRTSSGTAYLVMGNADGANAGVYMGAAASTTVFGTVTDAGTRTERMRIHSSGGVSIGNTTDPGAANLSVTGSANIQTLTVGLGGGAVSTNTAVGASAMAATATGALNTALGQVALTSLTSGQNNTALGRATLFTLTSGTDNTAVGTSALFNNNGSFNTSVGTLSLLNNTTGANNTAIGYGSLQNNTLGANNTASGYYALRFNTIVSNLTAIGAQALQSNTTNVATLGTITGGTGYTNGTYTGVVMTLSSGSTAVTYPTATIVVAGGVVTTVTITSAGVGFKDTTTVLTAPAASIGGTGSGFSVPVATLASGVQNTAVGYQALLNNTTASSNTALGFQALNLNTTGNNNVGIGYLAGYQNATSSNNVAIGQQSLRFNTAASNVSVGNVAGYANTTGAQNTYIGHSAGYGNFSANANTTGNNNVYVGCQTVGSAVGNSNEIVIGSTAVGNGSNTTTVGTTSTTLTRVFGVIQSTTYTVASLPSATTSGVGARAFVTDALAPTFGATVVTGGAVATPVYSDGTNWKVG